MLLLRRSLKGKIIVPIAIIFGLLVTIMTTYSVISFSSFTRFLFHEKIVVTANGLRSYLNSSNLASKAAAVSASTTPGVIKAVKERDVREITRVLTPMVKLYNIDFFVVTDETGTVLIRTHLPDIYGDSLSDRENIKNAIKGNIFTGYEEGITVKIYANTSSPVYDADGTLIGIIIAGVRLDTDGALDNLKEIFDADFTAFLGGMNMATTIIRDGKRITDIQLSPEVKKIMLEDKKEYLGNVDILGENYSAYYIPLVNPQGEVFAIFFTGHSNEHLIEEERSLIITGIIICILGLAIFVIVLLFIISKTIKPVKQLTYLVSEVTRGNVNISMDRTNVIEDEVGALILDIYSLIDIVKSMVSDLSQLVRELNIHRDISFRIDATKYRGAYKEIIGGIKTLGDSISTMNKVMTAMDNLDSMILIVDLDYNLIYVNRSLVNTFDLEIESYKGKKCYKTLRNLNQPCSMCLLPDMLPEKDKFPCKDYNFLYDDVCDLWLSGRGAIIRWVDGSMVYFQSINDDSDKKKAQEQLNEAVELAKMASAAKTTFLANMSHELRTPLNVIVGLTDLQLEDEQLCENARESLHKINNAGNILLNIVNDILDISKIESGKFMLSPVEYHMASLLNDTAILITSRIDEKLINFHLDISEDLPSKLYGDDLRVKQILNNLLSNAIKYTHKGSIELSVYCVRGGDSDVWMEISVKDTGIGIRPENLKKLFSDYNQIDTHANRRAAGTGLGLSITKKLVESMDGAISVESEHGKGSTFRARIRQGFVTDTPIGPVVKGNLCHFRYIENKRHFANNLVRIDLSHAKVLIVDDLQTNLDVAAGLMQKYKMQVDCVTSGQAAVERIKSGKPIYNAIFMDHMMPEMDGIEAMECIRALGTHYAQTVPIIALTANAVAGTEELFYDHGFQAFLTKPIDIMRLDSVIQQWVKGNRNANPLNDSLKELAIPDMSVPDSFSEEESLTVDIQGVDAEKGFSVCDGDQKIYLSVLRSYVAETSVILKTMRDVAKETLPSYITAVHGIKGSSATIGAKEISEMAADLEEMAREGDLLGISAKNDAFLKEIESLVISIKDWLEKRVEKTAKPRLLAPDRALLVSLRQYCEQYDLDGAEKIIGELDNADYEKDADLVVWLREKVDALDFLGIVERLMEYN